MPTVSPQLIDANVDEFFYTARERYNIMLRRAAGETVLTNDRTLAMWRFCNVFREDDATTVWVRENVREPLRDEIEVVLAMAVCRWINRVDNLQVLNDNGLITNWDGKEATRLLSQRPKVVTGAYVIKTPDGMSKAEGVCWIISRLAQEYKAVFSQVGPSSRLQEAWVLLKQFPYFGSFMAYEVISDLRHTYLLENAPDVNSWANPGPGAARGLSWLLSEDPSAFRVGAGNQDMFLNHMQKLHMLANNVPDLWPAEWPRWEMREVEHWLCEYAKYVSARHLNKRLKRKFP